MALELGEGFYLVYVYKYIYTHTYISIQAASVDGPSWSDLIKNALYGSVAVIFVAQNGGKYLNEPHHA